MRRRSHRGGAEVCQEEMHTSGDHIELAGKHVIHCNGPYFLSFSSVAYQVERIGRRRWWSRWGSVEREEGRSDPPKGEGGGVWTK